MNKESKKNNVGSPEAKQEPQSHNLFSFLRLEEDGTIKKYAWTCKVENYEATPDERSVMEILKKQDKDWILGVSDEFFKFSQDLTAEKIA